MRRRSASSRLSSPAVPPPHQKVAGPAFHSAESAESEPSARVTAPYGCGSKYSAVTTSTAAIRASQRHPPHSLAAPAFSRNDIASLNLESYRLDHSAFGCGFLSPPERSPEGPSHKCPGARFHRAASAKRRYIRAEFDSSSTQPLKRSKANQALVRNVDQRILGQFLFPTELSGTTGPDCETH